MYVYTCSRLAGRQCMCPFLPFRLTFAGSVRVLISAIDGTHADVASSECSKQPEKRVGCFKLTPLQCVAVILPRVQGDYSIPSFNQLAHAQCCFRLQMNGVYPIIGSACFPPLLSQV